MERNNESNGEIKSIIDVFTERESSVKDTVRPTTKTTYEPRYSRILSSTSKRETPSDESGTTRNWIDLFVLHGWQQEDVEDFIRFMETKPSLYR